MTKILFIYTLCANKKEAEKIATACVKGKLAACANVLSPAKSFFHWKGKFEVNTEVPVVMKTTSVKYAALEKRIISLHSYEIPCVIALPIEKGSKKYLDWVVEQV